MSTLARDSDILLSIDDVRKAFGVVRRCGLGVEHKLLRAIDGVSLAIRSGESFGIVGESGSGKSTLGRLVLGLDTPTSGSIRYRGAEVRELVSSDPHAYWREVQVIFQDPFSSLNPRMRIGGILAEPLRNFGGPSADGHKARIAELLQLVGLAQTMAQRYPHELSGGQRQRVAIAAALAANPRVIVADEAVSALDVSVQAQILNLLADLRRDLGLTLVFISHNLAVVEHICDEVAVMYLGRIVERAETDALFHRPSHPYTAALLASVLTPEPGLGIPDVGLGDSYPDPANVPPGCRFHPRCPMIQDACRTTEQTARNLAGRTVECMLAESA